MALETPADWLTEAAFRFGRGELVEAEAAAAISVAAIIPSSWLSAAESHYRSGDFVIAKVSAEIAIATNGVNAAQIAGVAVSSTAPTDGQILAYNASDKQYEPVAVNATEIQGVALATTAPTDTQVLEYIDADKAWEPTTAS